MNSTSDTVGYVSEPDGRGTTGLLWSCFVTILLCTWSAIHPNLPPIHEKKWKNIGRRIVLVLSCLLVPEWFAFMAISSVYEMMELRKRISQHVEWSLKQCFFLYMGGYVVKTKTLESDIGSDQPLKNGESSLQRPKPEVLVKLFIEKELPWPELSDEEISDRSKADGVVKALALIQLLWFITQIIGRAAQKMSVTTLELFTLAIVSCAVAMYVSYWDKPFDIQRPVIIPAGDYVLKPEDCIKYVSITELGNESSSSVPLILGVLTTLGFGGIHLAAWNFHFPSVPELWLWRVSSIGCATLPFLVTAFADNNPIIFGMVFAVYTFFRVYMFVEMFVSLRAAPASVYETPQWSQYFPAFG